MISHFDQGIFFSSLEEIRMSFLLETFEKKIQIQSEVREKEEHQYSILKQCVWSLERWQ